MLRKFLRDRRGNYAMLTAVAMVPIMGALTLAIDYAQMSRYRQATLNALDAANIATAWRLLKGGSESEVLAYAQDFFEANLGPVNPADATLHVVLPNNNVGGGTLKMSADVTYDPIFYPVFQMLLGKEGGRTKLSLDASSEVRLKNTLEVALVLDNSGSMAERGSGSGQKRIDLLKAAAKQLVDTLAGQAGMMKQVAKPVQFGIVPFAASVNVGRHNANASWMDKDGRSPIHHENFDWDTMDHPRKRVEQIQGVYYKLGRHWGDEEGDKVTRFTLYDEIKDRTRGDNDARWAGCVEMRPYPHGLTDEPPSWARPETLFVPMFAPDETDQQDGRRRASNNWWADETRGTARVRQEYMPKYFTAVGNPSIQTGEGPNYSCTTKPITPLTDVTNSTGLKDIKDSIDAMYPNGATNVPEGMAWGWRVVSGREPFTEGRGDEEKGNDKVVIVLTDGANTYYTPESLGSHDQAENQSVYSNYGYARNGRIFEGTSASRWNYSNDNYTEAMNQQFAQLCDNAKGDSIIVITVALDLDSRKREERGQIEALERCASDSRIRKDANGNPAKLFWNATGADLAETFKEIADELSNLRFVS